MPESKYPKEYTEGEIGDLKNAFKPEFRYDSRGRLIMPLPGYAKFMLSVEPGSKKIGQGSESEAGGPGTTPESLKSGYIFAETAIKVGPEGGWVAQIAGGDLQYPLSYFNETTEEVKFYLDKAGNVYLKGKIEAEEGGLIAGWTIGADELYVGLSQNSDLYRTGLKPSAWPFYVLAPKINGDYDPAQAVFRVNNLGQVWCAQLNILGGTGVANLADAGALALLDKANIDSEIEDGTIYKRIKAVALDENALVLLDQVIEGDYGRVKAAVLDANGLVLLDEVKEGTLYSRIFVAHIDAHRIKISSETVFATGYDPTEKEDIITKSATAPSSPATDDLWLDTSSTPNIWKRWTGSAWVEATDIVAGKSLSILTDRTLAFVADATTRKAVTANEKSGASEGYNILVSKLTAYGLSFWTANLTTRVQLTADGLKGYNAGNVQIEIKASDGKIYAKGGEIGGWILGTNLFKSADGNIELDPTAPHVKAIYGTNFVQMTSAASLPRIDLYKSGILRARFYEEGVYFYDAAGVFTGKITGSTSGGNPYINFETVEYLYLPSLTQLWANNAEAYFDTVKIASILSMPISSSGNPMLPGQGLMYFWSGSGRFRGADGANWRDLCFYDERNDGGGVFTCGDLSGCNLTDIGTRNHSSLQNISANQHHNRSHDHALSSDGQTLKPYYLYVNYPSGGARFVVSGNVHIYNGSIDIKAAGGSIAWQGTWKLSWDSANMKSSCNFISPGHDNLGDASNYWNEIRYKTLIDVGCLGVFDKGVELQDGRKVSDVEALQSIKRHPTLKTIYGVPRFDYRTMPKAVYKKAAIDGRILDRDKNDHPYVMINGKKRFAEDGAETTALISIMIGAIKELDDRLIKVEK